MGGGAHIKRALSGKTGSTESNYTCPPLSLGLYYFVLVHSISQLPPIYSKHTNFPS